MAHLIPYEPFPPRGGGALRCSNVTLQLARFHRTKLIVRQSARSIAESGVSIPESMEIVSPIDSPRSRDVFDAIPKGAGLRYRWLRRSLAGPANSIVGDTYHLLRNVLLNQKIDAIVLEHLEGMSVAPLIRRFSPQTKIIVDCHNVDHVLFKQETDSKLLNGKEASKRTDKRIRQIKNIEKSLGKQVDAFWACSDQDRNVLENLNPGLPGYTIPNGVDCVSMAYRSQSMSDNTPPTILFCGSLNFEANRDGLNWFAHECWPLIKTQAPNARLCVIGHGARASDYEALIKASNVDFVGEVESTLPFYQKANISICPLRVGSGTRLKILETLSVGTPCVSTPLGCGGIDVIDGEHILMAVSAEEFANQCIRLITDSSLSKHISKQGRKLVESKYDWGVIGNSIRESIQQVCETGRIG